MWLTNVWQLDAPSPQLRGAHKLLYKHSQFVITGELGNIWLGRNGAGRNHGEHCKHSCLPNKGITYVATAQNFRHLHFGTIVQQHLSHLCDASKTFHMLDTQKHILTVQKTETEHNPVHSQAFHVNSTEFTCSCTQSAQSMAAMCLVQTEFMEPF